MLEIKDLCVRVEQREILKKFSLSVKAGEIHAIMGPNGSGKSTLANVLGGREDYEITGGSISYLGKDLLTLSAEERACEGIFLAFQYPVELPGVLGTYFLRTAYNSILEHKAQKPLGVREFNDLIKEKAKLLKLDDELLKRPVNEGGLLYSHGLIPIWNGFVRAAFLVIFALLLSELKKKYREQRGLISELQGALTQVKVLRGLIPMCAWCKKVRDDSGFWEQVESYISKHSDASFTHGMCPDCSKKWKAEMKELTPS